MITGINLRDPVLINTIGHTAGLLLFALIIILLTRDRRAYGIRQTKLSIAAAALALAWNVGSLVALAAHDPSSRFTGVVMAASFSVLSLLPAVLLQLTLRGQYRPLSYSGYALSATAACLHTRELFIRSEIPHQVALVLIAVGFGGLTIVTFLVLRKYREWFSFACLLLFSISFVHFGYRHVGSPWAAEITWHHIGIPVALVVLLGDYRFLVLDTFIRFLMNSLLASSYVAALVYLSQRFAVGKQIGANMFVTGIALVALCLSLIGFAHMRNLLQRWIGRVIFRRQNLDDRVRDLTQLCAEAQSEDDLLSIAGHNLAAHLRTEQFAIVTEPASGGNLEEPSILFGDAPSVRWAEAQIPLRFSSGEVRYLLTGSRAGRQRYLSEDLDDMRRLGSAIVEQVERFRSNELKQLVTKAELRALQAQINPHFLFNALNTLYGTIDRGSSEARRMVLNLAEIFRYFLQGDRSFIPLSEELRIVRAYLEIEALRLGDRLETEITVSESARSAMIPILSIQPIVENAVKHGIATQMGRGKVSLLADTLHGRLRVTVKDTGGGFGESKAKTGDGAGVGLENVRRRLRLSYGPETDLNISSDASGSMVTFSIPVQFEKRVDELHAGSAHSDS